MAPATSMLDVQERASRLEQPKSANTTPTAMPMLSIDRPLTIVASQATSRNSIQHDVTPAPNTRPYPPVAKAGIKKRRRRAEPNYAGANAPLKMYGVIPSADWHLAENTYCGKVSLGRRFGDAGAKGLPLAVLAGVGCQRKLRQRSSAPSKKKTVTFIRAAARSLPSGCPHQRGGCAARGAGQRRIDAARRRHQRERALARMSFCARQLRYLASMSTPSAFFPTTSKMLPTKTLRDGVNCVVSVEPFIH
jgi:hypothetical protein